MVPAALLLCPFGQPTAPGLREYWETQLRGLGADFSRVIDGPTTSVQHFAKHLGRVAVLRNPRTRVIVALSRTQPLAISLLGSRRTLAGAAPALAQASWVVFLDPRQDSTFEAAARQLGELDGSLEDAPVWTSPSSERFLILSPRVSDVGGLPARLAVLQYGEEPDTAIIPRTVPPPSRASAAADAAGARPQSLADGVDELEVPQLGARWRR